MNNMKICVIGLGYVGLTFSLSILEKGFEVFGCDINEKNDSEFKKRNSDN